jgi:hypothetical protein
MQESGERCDAAFSENREPGVHRVCRKIVFKKIPEKFWATLFYGIIFQNSRAQKNFKKLFS